jgi:phage/plasmid-like protein (TIGR03299 family)
MAHELDLSNNQANIAYLGNTPWHQLGQQLEANQPIDVWAKAAGLDHEVMSAPVQYTTESGTNVVHSTKSVLYRSDTQAEVGIVGKNYKIVQPKEVLDFFAKLAESNNFQLETAGSLSGGSRIWAMAKVNDGQTVVDQDVVKPYVLLATSYDGTLPTIARFTTVRVVCSNTLGFAEHERGNTVKISHLKKFDANDCLLDLGVALNGFDKFMIDARKLANKQINSTFAVEFLKALLPDSTSSRMIDGIKKSMIVPAEDTKAFKSIMALFQGDAMGSDLPEASGSAWALLNAVTEHVDHGLSQNAAWFGYGNSIKNKAQSLLLEIVG